MELKVTSRTATDEQGICRKYHYSLLVDHITAGNFTCEDYGVQIQEENGDCARIPGITTSAVRIDELLSLLADNLVSPSSLSDVVADWL